MDTKPTKRSLKFTKRSVDAIPQGSGKGTWYADESLQGFYLISFSTGSKVFMARFRTGARRRVVKIGRHGVLTVEEARRKAQELLSHATLGTDPAAEREKLRRIPTFSKWAGDYLERVRLSRKQPWQHEYYLGLASARWGNRLITEISSADVESWHRFLAEGEDGERHPARANRALAYLSGCFNTAVRSDVIPKNPCSGIRPFRENPPRTRVLTDEEMKRLFEALSREDEFNRAAVLLIICTGARTSEVLGARWEDLDLAEGVWILKDPKGGRGQSKILPMFVIELLGKLPRLGPFVIPGKDPALGRYDIKSVWRRIVTRAGLNDCHVHDLRRTAGLAVTRRFGIYASSVFLGHSDVSVTAKVYSPLSAAVDLKPFAEYRTSILPLPAPKTSGGRTS